MKRTLLVVLSSLLISAPAVLVQAHDMETPGQEAAEGHHWDAARLQKDLGLSNDQVAKLKSARESEEAAIKPLFEKHKELMKKLSDQVSAKAPDSEIQATLADVKANRKAMMDQREQFQAQKEAILTPTQQAQMVLRHAKKFGERHGKGKMTEK